MRTGSKLLIAGLLGLGGAGVALAAEKAHVMKVALPDGSVAQIHYIGDVPPQIDVAPAQGEAVAYDPFADMDRMMAAMEAQSQAMFAHAALAAQQAAANPQMTRTAAGETPTQAGSYHYTYVSTTNGGNGACTQSYELTSYGDGKQQPKAVSQQSGDCKGVPALTPAVAPAPPATPKAPTPTSATKPMIVTKDAHVI